MTVDDLNILLLRAFDTGILTRLVASKPFDRSQPRRLTGKPVMLRQTPVLQTEAAYEGARVTHRHYTREELSAALVEWLESYGQINLLTSAGEVSCLSSKRGTHTVRGHVTFPDTAETSRTESAVFTPIDREKSRILSGDEPFLIALGISDPGGRVHDKRQAKFRQINRFLEIVRDIYADLPESGCLTVYDLCCGKSYLSFALYYYLTAMMHREVSMLCIDLKPAVIADCDGIARRLSMTGMTFTCGDVRNTPVGVAPDLLVSLHACDTATDIVIDTGITLGARVILSTPCCHRALSEQINCSALGFVTRHPQLRGKLCEALTDGMRLLRLEAAGYAVTALELTDPENTPKNTLLRAIRKTAGRHAAAAAVEYRRVCAFLLGAPEAEDSHADNQ